MDIIFSEIAKYLMNTSRKHAECLGTPALMPEHMFLSIVDNDSSCAYKILSHNVSKSRIKEIKDGLNKNLLNRAYPTHVKELTKNTGRIQLTEDFVMMLKQAKIEAISTTSNSIVGSEHLLLSMLKNKNLYITKYLNDKGLTYGVVRTAFLNIENVKHLDYDLGIKKDNYNVSVDFMYDKNKEDTKDTLLSTISTDLNSLAIAGKIDPVIGREVEIQRAAQVLSRRKKNNVLLIGQPGVGKTAIAEGLALAIVNSDVNNELINKRIVALNMASLVAGTKYRGQFEERIKDLIEDLNNNPNIILFIDEIHTIIGAGGVGGGALDASNMLKPVLTNGIVQCIGATTFNEYKQYVEKDGAFVRRFHAINVNQPTCEQTLEILKNIKNKYEKFHGVTYTNKAINACVNLSDRYISDRFFPDKAIDAMDESGALVNIKLRRQPITISKLQDKIPKISNAKDKAISQGRFDEGFKLKEEQKKLEHQLYLMKTEWQKKNKLKKHKITEEDVIKVISQYAKVPIEKINKNQNYNLSNMGKLLSNKIIGQEESIKKIVKTIQRSKIGLKEHNRPIGTFVFLGPTGVGKTSLAKEVAYQIFGRKESLIKIDMSEYMEKHSLSSLIGAPPGFVGYEQGGQLTEQVYRTPHSVVLFDEIEKAHQEIQNILLQIMDEGFITDTFGKKVDFRNTVLIMTSNIGIKKFEEFGNGIGFQVNSPQNKSDQIRNVVDKEMKKYFSPEFLGRIDEILIFNQLEKNHVLQILEIHLKSLYSRIKELGFKIKIDTKTKEFLAKKGYCCKYGVRPIIKSITQYIEDPITEKIISNSVNMNSTFSITTTPFKEPFINIVN